MDCIRNKPSTKEFEEEYVLPVSFDLTIFDNYSWSSFDEYFESAAQHYNGLEDIRIINESRTTLAERPAYNITYYDYRSGNYKVMDVSTYAGDEDIILGYIAEPGYFNKYLPGANKIINSFQLTNTTN